MAFGMRTAGGRSVARLGCMTFGVLQLNVRLPLLGSQLPAFVNFATATQRRDVAQLAASKAKKDPDAPKRPLSGFMRFAAEVRANNPEMKKEVAAIAKLAGEEWAKLTDQGKKPYNDAYATEKVKYEGLMEEYKASGKKAAWAEAQKAQKKPSKEAQKKGKQAAKKKDPNAPKKPLLPFFCFMAAFRKEHPELVGIKAAGPGGAKWKGLTAAEKAPFEEESRQLKQKYDREMEDYVKSGKQAAWSGE